MAETANIVYELDESVSDDLSPSPAPALSGLGSAFTAAQTSGPPYTEYFIDWHYSTDSGLRVLPRAASGDDQAIANSVVRTHRGITTLKIIWTAQRLNGKPKIPHWDTKDPNHVPLGQEITLCNKFQGFNNSTIYRVSGVYTYTLVSPKISSSKYPIGTTPAEISPSAANYYGPEDFDSTILDSAFASEGGQVQFSVRVGS